jgi:hypothetical protein
VQQLRRFGRLFFVSLLTVLWPLSALATRVPVMPMEKLFGNSAAVYLGTVRSVESPCREGKPPCTAVTFTDIELLAGKLPDKELRFQLPVGPMGDGTFFRIVGAPIFHSGQRYLVFVRSGDWYNTPVTNWFHSVFREVRPTGDPKRAFFVNTEGHAVRTVDEGGFHLGEPLAPPEEALSEQPSGVLQSQPRRSVSNGPRPSEGARKVLAGSGDLAGVALPSAEVARLVREMSLKFPLRTNPPVRLDPAGPALQRDQEAATNSNGRGLEPAAPEPGVKPYGQEGFTRDDPPKPEPLARRPSSRGQPLQ